MKKWMYGVFLFAAMLLGMVLSMFGRRRKIITTTTSTTTTEPDKKAVEKYEEEKPVAPTKNDEVVDSINERYG